MPRVWRPSKKLGVSRTSRYDLSAIEGFILVVHTSLGGDQLAFRYPPVTRTNISEETWTAVVGRSKPSDKAGGDNSGPGGSSSGGTSSSSGMTAKSSSSGKTGDTPTSPNEPPVSISYADTYSPYDMPSVMICNILSPKQSLCDKMFHTIIDQYRFFGFPTMVQKEYHDVSANDGARTAEEGTSQQQPSKSRMRTSSDGKSHRSENNSTPTGFPPTSSLNSSTGSNAGNSQTNGTSAQSQANGASPSVQHKDELTMFNLVMVVPKEVSWDVALVGQRMAVQLASALRHEQDRCHYVSTEVFKMLRLRERWFTQHRKQNANDSSPPPNHTALTYEMLQSSSLAQLIKNVYHSIRDEGSAQVSVNNWVQLSLNARSVYIPPSTSTSKATSSTPYDSRTPDLLSSKGENLTFAVPGIPSPSMTPVSMALRLINDSISQLMVRDMRPLRPYHTLLILNQSKIFDSLPLYASPSLRRVMESAVPTKSFREMQLDLGLPLEQLYRIAANFVYWKAAKVVDVLTRNNMYVLNPNPKDSDGNSAHLQFLAGTFENTFQSVKLFDLLSRFSTPKRLSEILQLSASQSKFVEMVTWLLRNDLIVQVHQFCYLQAPKLSSAITPASPSVVTHSSSGPHLNTPGTPGSEKLDRSDSSSKSIVPVLNVPVVSTPVPQTVDERGNNPMSLVTQLQDMDEARKTKEKEKRGSFASSPLHLMLAPISLTPSERLSLSQHDNGSKEFKLFLRLCPYFRGAHHLTEIAWRENITKEELLKVIGMYKHLIVTTLCTEEPINGSPEM